MTDMLAAATSGAGLAVLVLATRALALVYPREVRLAQPVQAVVRFVMDVMRENASSIAGTAP